MTLLSYLQSLRYSDGSSVLVSRGALSTEEEHLADASPRPYLMLFGLGDVEMGRLHDGSKEKAVTLDVLLEQRPTVPGQVPDEAEIMRLYHLVGDAPDHVDEVLPGFVLSKRLESVTGYGFPEQKHNPKDWLIGGVSFAANFYTRF